VIGLAACSGPHTTATATARPVGTTSAGTPTTPGSAALPPPFAPPPGSSSSLPGAAPSTGPAAAGAAGFRVYRNARYGFRTGYPAGFAAGQPPQNGDGLRWTDGSGTVSLVAFGANNVNARSVRQVQADDASGVHVTYSNVSGVVVTTSGLTAADTQILYRRDVVGPGSIDSLQWTYPASDKARWDAAVATTAAAFTAGAVSRSH